MLCFWDDFFFFWPFIIFSGVLFWGIFGPIGHEAKAKTVIISGIAVTAGQFLVINLSGFDRHSDSSLLSDSKNGIRVRQLACCPKCAVFLTY